MTDSEKIRQIVDIKGITVGEAERQAGIKASVLSKLLQRNGKLSEFNREKVLRTFHVKHEWWRSGKGDIFEENGTEGGKNVSVVEEEAVAYRRAMEALVDTKDQIIELQKREIKRLEEELRKLRADA